MSSTTDADGSEDVNDFLLRIRELGERRDKEDEERTKKLEEEILQGRKERQARRAERARSISPTKDSPILDSSRLSTSSFSLRPIDPPEQLEPTPRTPERDTILKPESVCDDESIFTNGSRRGSKIEGIELDTSPKAPSTSLRSRAGTLSWQQRPSSREVNRPFFSTSPVRENRWRAMSSASDDDRGLPGSPFAHSPSAKEAPSLKPTEPEASSPVHTKVADEEGQEPTTHEAIPKELEPASEHTAEAESIKEASQHDLGDIRSRSPSRASSTIAESSLGHRYSSVSSISTATGLGSPVPLSSAQKLEPRTEAGSEEQPATPLSPRRLSPERSTSPTKGLGGFVQSAMMKRSDSVSKRWSAQLPSGLTRGHSLAGNRNSYAAPSAGDLLSSPSAKLTREGPPLAHRPSSSHSEATIVKDNERPATPPVSSDNGNTRHDESPARPQLALHTRSSSALDNTETSSLPPTSPVVSRTMDPKRWSPTKSTWLESALNRPDSPRHKKQPSQSTPWSRERQSRGSIDMGRSNTFKEVTPVGLMRTAVLGGHSKTPSISGMPDLLGTAVDAPGKTKEDKHTEDKPQEDKAPGDLEATSTPVPEDKTADKVPEALPKAADMEPETTGLSTANRRKRAPTLLAPTPKGNFDSPVSPTRDPLLNRPKPQSPVIDFRANLRKREVVKDQGPKEEPEFKNVFGKLKRTETSSYVPPDALKNNILKGKAALTATGGPKKNQKVDELKDSILKQKEAIKASGGSLRRNTAGENDAPTDFVPEAITKRHNLTKSSSVRGDLSDAPTLSPREPGTPQLSPRFSPGSEHFDRSPSPQTPAMEEKPDVTNNQGKPAEIEGFPKATQDEDGRNDLADEPSETIEEKQERPSEEAIQPVRALPSGDEVQATNASVAAEGLATKGKLAGRINPALAGLLSRGPPAAVDVPTNVLSNNSNESPTPEPAAPLTHMTKSRARGPKRRLPNTVNSETAETHSGHENGTLAISSPTGTADLKPLDLEEHSSQDVPQSLDIQAQAPNSVDTPPEPTLPEASPSAALAEEEVFEPAPAPKDEPSTEELYMEEVETAMAVPSLNGKTHLEEVPSATKEEMELAVTNSAPKEEPVSWGAPHSPASQLNAEEAAVTVPAPKEEPVSWEVPQFPASELNAEDTAITVHIPKEEHSQGVPTPTVVVEDEGDTMANTSLRESSVYLEELPSPGFQSSVSVNTPSEGFDSPRSSIYSQHEKFEAMDETSRGVASQKDTSHIQEAEGAGYISGEALNAMAPPSPDTKEPDAMRQSVEPVHQEAAATPDSSRKVIEDMKQEEHTLSPEVSISQPEEIKNQSPIQDLSGSSSGWPLPNSDMSSPISSATGLTQPASTPIAKPTEFKRSIPRIPERDSRQSLEQNQPKPTTGVGKLAQRFEKANEDIGKQRESFRPVPPPKASPAPSTPDFQQSRGSPIHFSSPSPSPLRSSFKQNQNYPSPTSYRSPREKSLPSPPVPPKSSPSVDRFSSPRSARSSTSLVPQADESYDAISRFFKPFPNPSDGVNIDAQLMLMNKKENSKIRTLRKQMWEITGDGKKQDLPVHQEYILFEGSMYLCVHHFEADGGAKSEAHLWCGDDVPDAAVDDAQSFSRKVAKENGCKLEVIKQGKETTRFIQALGGILITRRGLSSRSSSSAFFMLCGRKHLGQMVFDEVNFAPQSLCSGYPFVISAMFGKVYLWKGQGSAAEEVGAARLIGMDLGLTGEFEEVAEGEEPGSFFESFPQHGDIGDYRRTDYWRLKPNHECYRPRLLRIDHELGQRSTGFWLRRPVSASPVTRPNDTVQEMEPFCQKDLKANGIYVLDTFFEIYVIVGEQASTRPAEFVSAIVFAHEYGILAASLQDRPFIPKSFVSLGGVPDSCRTAFRKWQQPSLSIAPQVFPLNAAIEAIRS